jgi:predicted nucleic acid-binding protein
MRRVLLDLNLVLDVLLDRQPHAESACALWAAVEMGEAEGLIAAHCVTTLHYLAARSGGRQFGDGCVAGVLSVFGVATVDADVLQQAVAMRWADFEDAVCAAAATGAGCQIIATRDPRGFRGSVAPAMTPEQALAAIRAPEVG